MQCSRLSSPVHSPLILVQYITPSDWSALPISSKTETARLRQDQKSGRARLGRGYENRSKVIARLRKVANPDRNKIATRSDLKSNPSISRISKISVSKGLEYSPQS